MTVPPETLLKYATQLRIPLTNQLGGYGEVTIERGPGPYRDRWAVTDGALVGLRAWTGTGGWQYVRDIGWAATYIHTLDEAFTLGQQVAEIEGACLEAKFEALRTRDN